jgi:hypothetical protein
MGTKVTLQNGKVITLRYLLKEELDILLQVPTTVEQAKTIRKRNLTLLSNYRRQRNPHTKIGCPHCQHTSRGFQCKGCAWTLIRSQIRNADGDYDPDERICVDMTFNGNCLNESSILYGYNKESISIFDELSKKTLNEAFLMGHVEWARAVIALGGVRWPNGVMSSERQPIDTSL